MPEIQNTIHTRPPAKLNLFLELIAKRQDGFHEIDTVMVAIDLCDEMRVGQIDADEIKLNVHWLPSTEIVAQRLGLMGPGIEQNTEKMAQLLQIPESDGNLVYRALAEFKKRFEVDHGFAIELGKRIPAGAGLGGASSDAASALLCAAELTGVSKGNPELTEIASSLGSDIPFFLGVNGTPVTASRGRGRGEVLDVIDMGTTLDFVVVYPSDSLSTPKVYANSTIAESPGSADGMVTALAAGNVQSIQSELHNQLSQPAKKILPRIEEILESMWRSGLQACQLTGSGSACFAIADSSSQARHSAMQLQAMLEPGAFVTAARSVSVPPELRRGD